MRTSLWSRWTLNCAFGELAGIGAAGAIAYWMSISIGESDGIFSKLTILFAMMCAGLIEGSLLGFFQWRVLKEKFKNISRLEWINYTAAVAMLGWFLGMLPSLFFVPSEPTVQTSGVDLNQPWLFGALCVGSGLFLGAIFGAFQWVPLRKHTPTAGRWILANALGWGAGLGWIYLFASMPTEGSSMFVLILMGIIGGALAGLSVGAITGIFLVGMKNKKSNRTSKEKFLTSSPQA